MRPYSYVVLGLLGAGLLRGEGVTIRLEPDRVEAGVGGPFSIVCRLENPLAVRLVAYQLFIGYDAAAVRAEGVSWPDDGVLREGNYAAGIFDGRDDAPFAEWRDGIGTDTVSVSGFARANAPESASGVFCVVRFRVVQATTPTTAFGLDPGPYWSFSGVFDAAGLSVSVTWDLSPVKLNPVPPALDLSCRHEGNAIALAWTAPAAAVDGIEVARNGERLGTVSGTTTSFLDDRAPLGAHLYTVVSILGSGRAPAATCAIERLLAGPRDVSCNFDGTLVALRWTNPFAYSAIDLSRNGTFLVRIAGDGVSYEDASVGGLGSVSYQITGTIAGLVSERGACTVEVSVAEGDFLRGDANVDGSRSLSDAVVLLRFLFSGGKLKCLDAGDFDDNGKLGIADPVGVLGWLFRGGVSPPPPFLDPGKDPTPDTLSCAEGIAGH